MTKKQTTAEMKYQLGKCILQVLLDANYITTEEATQIKVALPKEDLFFRMNATAFSFSTSKTCGLVHNKKQHAKECCKNNVLLI